MKKNLYLLIFALIILFAGIIIFLDKKGESSHEISRNPTVFPVDNPENYPNEFIWSYRRSNGVLEYKNDYSNKYKILSNEGVTNTILELYDPLFVTYNGKIDIQNLEWEYKLCFDFHQNYEKLNSCVIYITKRSIIINEYEYLITGNDKVSKDECLLNILEKFEWFYEHEKFGEIVMVDN